MKTSFKNRLITALGGVTQEQLDDQYNTFIQISSLYHKAIQDICFRGMGPNGPVYYDWACEYCCRLCNKRNGWCDWFAIGPKIKENK